MRRTEGLDLNNAAPHDGSTAASIPIRLGPCMTSTIDKFIGTLSQASCEDECAKCDCLNHPDGTHMVIGSSPYLGIWTILILLGGFFQLSNT